MSTPYDVMMTLAWILGFMLLGVGAAMLAKELFPEEKTDPRVERGLAMAAGTYEDEDVRR